MSATYAEAIARAIGEQDRATVTLVEDLMRVERTGLDSLTADQLAAAAREALAVAKALARLGQLRDYCKAVGIDAPAWANAPIEGVVICWATAAQCLCVLPLGHDGPHTCWEICRGSWTGSMADGTFAPVCWPGAL